jgi:LmbE family N-acetylglucosaminyl deacetylase
MFLLCILAAQLILSASAPLNVLCVHAHPDDESEYGSSLFAASLAGVNVDLAIVTSAGGGFHFSEYGANVYNVDLQPHSTVRGMPQSEELMRVRQAEALAATRRLGMRRVFFGTALDGAFTTNLSEVQRVWWSPEDDVYSWVAGLLNNTAYDFITFMMPVTWTHGEHQGATLLALKAAQAQWQATGSGPIALGASANASLAYQPLPGHETLTAAPTSSSFTFNRSLPLNADGYMAHMNFDVVRRASLASYISQGETLMALNDPTTESTALERFWFFTSVNGPASFDNPQFAKAQKLFQHLASATLENRSR